MKLSLTTMLTGTTLVALIWINPDMKFTPPDCVGFMQPDAVSRLCEVAP